MELEYTSDLSLYCWYQDLFAKTFRDALKTPAYTRYSIACVSVCSHFTSCRHELCPEEFQLLKTRSLTPAQKYLEEMASEGKKLLVHIYNERVALSDRLLPYMSTRNTPGDQPKKKRKNKAKG